MAGSLKVNLSGDSDIPLEHGMGQLNTTHAAMTFVASNGIPLPAPPVNGFRGEMPPDITVLDDNQLGQLLNNIGQWCSFLDFQVSSADSDRKSAEAELTYVRARIRMAIKAAEDGRKLTVSDKNDIMDTDPRVVAAWSRSLYTESIYQLTRSLRDRAQRSWETVSRRITQRGQEVDRARRESNVAGVPAVARTFRHS